jgi:putative ABC transport system ATP-binding protein
MTMVIGRPDGAALARSGAAKAAAAAKSVDATSVLKPMLPPSPAAGRQLKRRREASISRGIAFRSNGSIAALPDISLPPVVVLDQVHLTLGDGASQVEVLRGLDLTLTAGGSTAILGPSGSGKSSLLMLLTGLERASVGTVQVAGEDLTRLDEDALARFRGRSVGIVFQSFHLIPTMTALENVAVPLELAGVRDAQARAAAELASVGLGHRLDHFPSTMSGGEQQRVAIARALVAEPAIIVADEPTGNLDATTGKQIADLIFAARERRGASLILVTHDEVLARRCDRLIRIADGRIVTTGEAA